MVFYVTKNGTVLHESQAYIYKNEIYSKEELKDEATKDLITLKNWGFD